MTKHVISFHYTLKDKDGKLIESSRKREPLSFLQGTGSIIPLLEEQLLLLKIGDTKQISIAHQQAYGAYDQNLIYKVPRTKFPMKDIKVGDVFQINDKEALQLVTVVELMEEDVILDANHPLAGIDLNFDVEIMTIREATADEIAHGHAHGAGGHHH